MLSFSRRLGDELEVQKRVPCECGNYVGLQRMELGLSVDDFCMVHMTVADNIRVLGVIRFCVFPISCPFVTRTAVGPCRSITRGFLLRTSSTLMGDIVPSTPEHLISPSEALQSKHSSLQQIYVTRGCRNAVLMLPCLLKWDIEGDVPSAQQDTDPDGRRALPYQPQPSVRQGR